VVFVVHDFERRGERDQAIEAIASRLSPHSSEFEVGLLEQGRRP